MNRNDYSTLTVEDAASVACRDSYLDTDVPSLSDLGGRTDWNRASYDSFVAQFGPVVDPWTDIELVLSDPPF